MSNVKVGLSIAGAGAAGGVLFWLLTVFSNTIVFGSLPVVGRIFGCGALGSAAAFAGVFLITASDVTKALTYVFAMLCGMAWQPVLNSSLRMIANNAAGTAADQAQSQAKKLTASVASSSTEQVHQEIQSTVSDVNKSVSLLNDGADIHARNQLVQASKEGIRSVASASTKDPQASVTALTEIAQEALKSKQTEVATTALASLAKVANQGNNPALTAMVDRSFQHLAAQTKQSQLPDKTVIADSLRGFTPSIAATR